MRKFALVTLCLLGIGVRPAAATALDITAIAGVWNNPTGGQNLNGVGTSTVSWGTGVIANDSGYNFTAGANLLGVTAGVPLFFGTFTHTNQPIPSGSAITGIDLDFSFLTNGTPTNVAATFAFNHNETPNNCTCSPGDDDIVTIVTPIVNVPITVGSDTFYFNLLGFSQNGGVTYNNVYSSPEGGSNTTSLYGAITDQPLVDPHDLGPAVPEPGSLILFGSGLVGLVALRRRTRRA